MPFTVRPDGTIITDTAEEALALQRAIMSAHAVPRRGFMSGGGATVMGTGIVSDTPLSLKVAEAKKDVDYLLTRLKPYNGKTISSEDLLKIIEVKSVMGVGPRLRGFRSSFASLGGSMDDVLVAEKASNGTVSWKVRL
jgi:hypothetical protein